MSPKRATSASVIVIALFTLTGPKQVEAAELALPEAYKSIVTSTSALSSSATELVRLERTTLRLQRIRTALTAKLLVANFGDKFSINDLIEEQDLLCGARANHISTVARYNYVNAVTSQIEEISKPSSATDILSAIKIVLASYSVDVSDRSLSATSISQLKNIITTRCQTDIRGFDKAYYGTAITGAQAGQPTPPAEAPSGTEALPSLAFLGPFGALIDTVLGIITPVLTEAANIVDQSKRKQAIEDFLSDQNNQNSLRSAGQELAQAVSDYTWATRLKSAGAFVEGVMVIRKSEIDLARLDSCKDPNNEKFVRSASGAPSARFVLCWRAAWGQLESTVASTLKAAEDYDELADAGDSATALTAFRRIDTEFTAISRGNSVNDPQAFWQFVLQIVSFANTLQTAFSQDNRERIHKAIDGLVHSP
jgi:hypothetical protein